MRINAAFRRYHRQIAIVMSLPLTLTIVTGVLYPIFDEWLHIKGVTGFLLGIHSGRIFGLEAFYPLVNGLGLAVLMLTGLSQTSLFRKKSLVSTHNLNPLKE